MKADEEKIVMVQCEKTPTCQFYGDKMENMPAEAAAMKEAFCMSQKEACARYVLSTSGRPVPPDLFPDMIERARGIIARTFAAP
jgi:hypothetical protein